MSAVDIRCDRQDSLSVILKFLPATAVFKLRLPRAPLVARVGVGMFKRSRNDDDVIVDALNSEAIRLVGIGAIPVLKLSRKRYGCYAFIRRGYVEIG